MPKIRRPPPAGILNHLLERFRDGRIAITDFTELKQWLESDIDVPEGAWFKRFAKFTLAGEGEMPKTFLTPEMVPRGKEIH
jgi:hypothetical protein